MRKETVKFGLNYDGFEIDQVVMYRSKYESWYIGKIVNFIPYYENQKKLFFTKKILKHRAIILRNDTELIEVELKDIIPINASLFEYRGYKVSPQYTKKGFIRCFKITNSNTSTELLPSDFDGTHTGMERWIDEMIDGEKDEL